MATGNFLTELVVRQRSGDRWELREPLIYEDEDGTEYVAPCGMETDFASIPRGLWNLFPKSGRHTKAAVIHDWLCQTKVMDSDKAHALFRRALKACGVSKIGRTLMFIAVKAGGPNFKAVRQEAT